ncbi:hypothetical protein HPB50_028070 [Hyalomma asiaticum]|nr:hypothetical protein HPB50_028070 [Hyalomma asiaticum]
MNEDRPPDVTCWEKFSIIICLPLSIFGLVTDGIALYTYGVGGLWFYFGVMLFLAVVPNVMIQAFSISWQIADDDHGNEDGCTRAIFKCVNLLLFGTIHKQCLTIEACCQAAKTKERGDYEAYKQHRSDLCLLDLYKLFLKQAPQLVLQVYIMYDTKDWSFITIGTPIICLIFLAKGVVDYDKDQRHRCPNRQPISWCGVLLHTLWRLGIITSRIGAMVLMAVVDDEWAISYFGIHFVMTSIFAFTLTQQLVRKEVAPDMPLWQKCAHGIAMGAALTFSFFNIADSSSHPWMIIMYMYAAMQNAEAVAEFFREWQNTGRQHHGMIAMIIVGVAFIAGLLAMGIYNRLYKPVCTVSLFPSRVPMTREATSSQLQVEDLLESVERANHAGHNANERSPLV